MQVEIAKERDNLYLGVGKKNVFNGIIWYVDEKGEGSQYFCLFFVSVCDCLFLGVT